VVEQQALLREELLLYQAVLEGVNGVMIQTPEPQEQQVKVILEGRVLEVYRVAAEEEQVR
jgi:hypothetical protein